MFLVNSATEVEDGTIDVALIRLKRLWKVLCSVSDAKPLTQVVKNLIRYLEDVSNQEPHQMEADLAHPGTGRSPPSYSIGERALTYLVEEMFMSVPDIARIFKVSISTIKRRMREFDIAIRATYSTIEDNELDKMIYKLQSPLKVVLE